MKVVLEAFGDSIVSQRSNLKIYYYYLFTLRYLLLLELPAGSDKLVQKERQMAVVNIFKKKYVQ